MNSLLRKAIEFAGLKHKDQRRKFGNQLQYIIHPMRVMHVVSQYNNADDILAASVLHDVVEDTPTTVDELRAKFGPSVAYYVDELTNRYTSELYPFFNRKKRKELELSRISRISTVSKLVKAVDRIDNLNDIGDEGFLRSCYLRESWDLFKVLRSFIPYELKEEFENIVQGKSRLLGVKLDGI